MSHPLSDDALDQLFREARTHRHWIDRPVSDATLLALLELMKLGPTSANCSPARIVFVVSEGAKERLRPHLSPGNVRQTMAAPATAVLGYDLRFYEHMPRLYPENPQARSWFEGEPAEVEEHALRNASLQGGYFIMAARALGLDCGPMGGFDKAGVGQAFFPEGRVKANFLCNLGYGDPTKLRPRGPRFDARDIARIV